MGPDNWDQDFNEGSVTSEQLLSYRQQKSYQLEEERLLNLGYINFPYIENNIVRDNFPRWTHFQYIGAFDRETHMGVYGVNRLIWLCHNCGCFGYKQSLRETFVCYSCRSRNVIVCRAGEISMAIRNLQVGTSMSTIFNRRKERLKLARKGVNSEINRIDLNPSQMEGGNNE